jgi:hypothetical protein
MRRQVNAPVFLFIPSLQAPILLNIAVETAPLTDCRQLRLTKRALPNYW